MSENKQQICKNCKYAKLDELWGEYKCLNHQYRVYNPTFKWLWDTFSFVRGVASDKDCPTFEARKD